MYISIKKMSWQISCCFKNFVMLGCCPNDFRNQPLGDVFFKNGSKLNILKREVPLNFTGNSFVNFKGISFVKLEAISI